MKQLLTDRLVLREIRDDDISDIVGYMDNEEIGQYVPNIPYPYSAADAKDWISSVRKKADQNEAYDWAIEYEGAMVGAINLHNISTQHMRCETGYMLSADFQRRGIMSEALNKVLQYAFTELSMRRVGARVYHKNIPSMKLLESFGFQKEGIIRDYETHRGVRYDDHVYGLLADEYTPR